MRIAICRTNCIGWNLKAKIGSGTVYFRVFANTDIYENWSPVANSRYESYSLLFKRYFALVAIAHPLLGFRFVFPRTVGPWLLGDYLLAQSANT